MRPGRWSRSSSWATVPRPTRIGPRSSTCSRSAEPRRGAVNEASFRRGLRRLGSLLAPRGFRLLLTSQLLNQVADGLYQIALASVLIFGLEAARTPAQVTKVLAVTLLPFSLVGPFTGPFIDRFSRRSILVGTSVVRTGLILLLLPAVSWPEPVLLALAVAAVSVNRFYHATKNAVMPMVVPPEHYLGANAVSSTAGMVFALGGAVIGGPLTDAVSPRLPILLAAVCTVGSAVAAAGLVLPHGERRGLAGVVRELRDNVRDVRDGLRVLLGSSSATYAVSSTWAMRALHGFVILAALVVGRARFDIGASGFSVVLAAVGVGGVVGCPGRRGATRGAPRWRAGRGGRDRTGLVRTAWRGVASVLPPSPRRRQAHPGLARGDVAARPRARLRPQRRSPLSGPWWARPGLEVRHGRLRIAGRDGEALAREHGTPLYAYDLVRMEEQARALRDALARAGLRHRVRLALKAQRAPEALAVLRALGPPGHPAGVGIDACSPRELLHALEHGWAPEEISYTGTNVSERDLDVVLAHPVHINVDLLSQLERVGRRAPGRAIGLRVNPRPGD